MRTTWTRARLYFRFCVGLAGLLLGLTGFTLVKTGSGFAGGFSLVLGIQVFLWAIGLRLILLGNATREDLWQEDLFQEDEVESLRSLPTVVTHK